jgi:hypothetical protein
MSSDERDIFLVEFGDCDRRLLHLLTSQQQLLRLPLLTSLFLFFLLLLVGVFHLLQQFLVCLHENWLLDLSLVYPIFLIDDNKRGQFDSENTSSRSLGFDRNPFNEFKDDIYKDKTRPTHDSFTGGSTRRRRGDDITRELAVDFVEAVKSLNMGNSSSRHQLRSQLHLSKLKQQ